MRWFKHDSNAHIDAKLKKVKHRYGITGYGLYWYCLELIALGVERTNITFQLEEDAETIAVEWSLDQLKVQEIMEYMVKLGLFENNDGVISCLKLAKRLDDTNSKNPEIKNILEKLKNNSETFGETPSNSGQSRLDETKGEEKKKVISRFTPPTLEEVIFYCRERQNNVDPNKFINHYEANGWMRGKTKVKDWKACVRTWEEKNNNNYQPQQQAQMPKREMPRAGSEK